MTKCSLATLLTCLLLSTVLTLAQTASPPQGTPLPGLAPRIQSPPRDGAGVPAPVGTARILGRVVSAENGVPLRRAQVRINAAEQRVTKVAMTDADGRYQFTELPAGRYSLNV